MVFRRFFAALRGATPQTEPLPGMVPNNAGGFAYAVDDWNRLDRFLMLGSEGGTYHVGEHALTRDNALAVQRCLAAEGERVVRRTVEISDQGRAPKNDPALFVLAMAAGLGDAATRRAALAALPQVARIGTHLFQFAEYAQGFRGWGRGLRRAVAGWYGSMPLDRLALQVVKYRQRNGWSHRDLLRLSHPVTAAEDQDRRALFDFVCGRAAGEAGLSPLVAGFRRLAASTDAGTAAELIREFSLPRECVPTSLLNAPEVWNALLAGMPMTALIRNLGKMTAIGLLQPLSDAARDVAERLGDEAALRRARLHPIAILLALKTYARGRGERGKLSWTPVPAIIDALDRAFDASFRFVEPTGKRLLLGIDVSGSMIGSRCAGSAALNCAEAAAAVAMTVVRTEPHAHVMTFDTVPHDVALSPRQRLDDVLDRIRRTGGGGTDLAQPMLYGLQNWIPADVILVLTDSETWAGRRHPVEALSRYRRAINPGCKLVVLAAAANQVSVADPDDPLSLGIAGFDAAVPQIIQDFIGA